MLQILTVYSIYHDVHWFRWRKIFRKDLRWYSRPGLWIESRPRSRSRSRSCPIEIFITLLPSGFSLTGSKWAYVMILVAAAASNTTLFSGIRSMHLLWRTWRFERRRDKSACRLSHANEHCSSALVLSLPPRSPPPPGFSLVIPLRLCSMSVVIWSFWLCWWYDHPLQKWVYLCLLDCCPRFVAECDVLPVCLCLYGTVYYCITYHGLLTVTFHFITGCFHNRVSYPRDHDWSCYHAVRWHIDPPDSRNVRLLSAAPLNNPRCYCCPSECSTEYSVWSILLCILVDW